MQIAVLGSHTSWYLKDLVRAAQGRHEVVQATFKQLRSDMGDRELGVRSAECDLSTVDAVLVRTMPPGSLEQVVFRMNALARLEREGQVVVNSPRALEVAVDKYLALAKLQAVDLKVPRTHVCQTADDALAAFHALGGDIVLKPLFGAEGRGIARLTDEALADRAFRMLEALGAVLYLQEFIPHGGFDLRLFVVGEMVLGMRRGNPLDWRTNISRGAVAEPIVVTDEYRELALRAARAVEAPLSGVDLLPGRDGELYAIEVNAVPGWRALARALDRDVASLVLDYVEDRVRRKPSTRGQP